MRTFWKLSPETLTADTKTQLWKAARRPQASQWPPALLCVSAIARYSTAIDNIDGEINLSFLLSLTYRGKIKVFEKEKKNRSTLPIQH
jgi:elongation factor P hydroxylase